MSSAALCSELSVPIQPSPHCGAAAEDGVQWHRVSFGGDSGTFVAHLQGLLAGNGIVSCRTGPVLQSE